MGGPEFTRAQLRKSELQIDQGRRKKPIGVELRVCDPQGGPEKHLFTQIARIEPLISERAETEKTNIVVVLTDKSRQNAINKLGGTREAGDQAVKAYWDALVETADTVARANKGKRVSAEVIRVSPSSDEGIIIIYGNDLDSRILHQFNYAWSRVRDKIDLRKYEYTLRSGYGSVQVEHRLDLEAFSRVLRHIGLIVACNSLMARPKVILPYSKGFVRDEIRRLEDSELSYYYLLPQSFRGHGGGLAEVETPFDTNLERLGRRTLTKGTYVEIKIQVNGSGEVLVCIDDNKENGTRGSRKGFAEVYSGRFGMRGFNTFMGKAQTNKVLTAVAQGVYDFASEFGSEALPVSGSYMTYWFGLDMNEPHILALQKSITARMQERSLPTNDFSPMATTIGASQQIWLSELRARFILQSLERDEHHTALDKVDFLINFIENVNPIVQKAIFDEIWAHQKSGDIDKAGLESLRYICARRRTVRDTEDLVWTLRMDTELPFPRQERARIEDWLFRFSNEHFERMFTGLAKIVEKMKEGRDRHDLGRRFI